MGENELIGVLSKGYAICRASAIDNSTTLLSLFLAGLAGGGSHCVGMCGPIVLSQVSSRLEEVPASSMSEFSRLKGAALAPYHAGRMTTYSLLGASVALISGGIIHASGFKYVATGLLVLAGLFFLGYAAKMLGLALPGFGSSGKLGPLAGRLSGLARPLFRRPVGWRGYMLGVALGFIPCGLLYGALAAASSTADPLAGFLVMIAFALGTIPALLVVGFGGHIAIGRWRGSMSLIAPVLLIVNGGFLLIMAWRL
ncbi:MAG: sulfite exporter TauE/SafE family protein [Rhodospirillales bacterium]|nr:sulfite exporter TauE/SafE family protein [Rhodospirillales bacterium]